MAYTQLIYCSAILLSLFVSNKIPLTQGRQLKSAGRVGSHAIKLTLNIAGHNHGDNKSAPNAAEHQSFEFNDSVAGFEDEFKPIVPGNSPGIGHAFAGHKDRVQRNLNRDGTVVNPPPMASTQDQSPGVGHYGDGAAVNLPSTASSQDHGPGV